MTYGYVRVSSRDQNEERQLIAMRERGIDAAHTYVDKQSGKDFDRPRYQALLKRLRPGDVVVVKSIDRLGRNYDEILEQWRLLIKDKGCDVIVLDMPLLDTTRRNDTGLMGKVIADIVLQLLSYVAQTEREFIRQRQAEGIAAAKARGVHMGRKPKTRPPQTAELLQLYREGQISASNAARVLGVSHNTVIKWAYSDDQQKEVSTPINS